MSVYCKDSVEYLRLAVDSMINQTYDQVKVFLGVDGPVGDEINACLNEYKKNEKIQLVKFEENQGLAKVLNHLLELCFAEGFEYIARMDADDISCPDRIEKQVNYLVSHPEIDVVGGFAMGIDENGTPRNVISKHPETPEECRKAFAYSNPLGHPAVMFRKSYFDKAGCLYRPDHKVNQDTLLWFDGLMKGVNIANVQELVIYSRTTPDRLKKRRGGYAKAKKQFQDRLMINKGLGYGFKANLYAFCVFMVMIAPYSIRKFAFKHFR